MACMYVLHPHYKMDVTALREIGLLCKELQPKKTFNFGIISYHMENNLPKRPLSYLIINAFSLHNAIFKKNSFFSF